MRSWRKPWGKLLLILAVSALAAWIDQPRPLEFLGNRIAIRPGLDLQGGTQLRYELDLSGVATEDIASAEAGVVEVIRQRIDAFGVTEPIIQPAQIGNTRTVLVELPGVQDVTAAKNLIGATAQLSFWESEEGSDDPASPLGPGWKKTELTGAHLRRAVADLQQTNGSAAGAGGVEPVVTLEFDDEGAKLFEAITERNVGRPVAIVLDDQAINAPTVSEKISGGSAIITGLIDIKAARQIAIQLTAGALPVPVSVIEERTVGATLGDESVARSIAAGLIGAIVIIVFMLSIYRLAGLAASFALVSYFLITFALFKLFGVTLTLASIAGLILSIGMAVDANILIFERMREERRAGKHLALAIEEGFRRAWSSVRDSNLSSLLTAAILFYFGSGLVRGFALTLAIGIVVSIFTATTVTRTLLKFFLREQREPNLKGVSG